MAHRVILETAGIELSNRDLVIKVSATAGMIGTCHISKGNFEWRPANKSVKHHRLTWREFAKLMEAQGKPVKKSK
jgi:hypothetical protein